MKSVIEHQKKVADEILSRLFPIDPYCIVAGGAPRDWHFDKPATDIDVFFHCGNKTLSIVSEMLSSIGLTYTDVKLGGTIPSWYKMNPDLLGVYCLEVEGVKVQLMRMSKPTWVSVIPNFPLSICHTWYKNGVTKFEKPFLRGEKHKAIYKTSEIYNYEHQYVQKILVKFPEWKYYDSVVKLAESMLDN